MATRPWHRLDEGFVARVLPRVSRSRFLGDLLKPVAGDGAALLQYPLENLMESSPRQADVGF